MEFKEQLIKGARAVYRKVFNVKFENPECETDRQTSNDLIHALLIKDKPCMISRFGTVELNCINNYLCIESTKKDIAKMWDFITDDTQMPWWNKNHFKAMELNAGIFPQSIEISESFAKRYLTDIPEIDLLGSFQYQEKFTPLRKDVIKVQLETLYPFFVDRPWTRGLSGKKVLVVHPFEESIRSQYANNREKLFANKGILPDFHLLTIKAIQSSANESVKFINWFEALFHMECLISKIDFDVCILGCGAYGLPLAAFVKRLGKKAIHLGGGTQLLFGIKGKRWENGSYKEGVWHYRPNQSININYGSIFNQYWVYPRKAETPLNASKVEGACYW